MTGGHFQIEILAWPGKLLVIRELYVVAEVTLFLKVLSLWTNLSRVGKTLCMNNAPKMGQFWSINFAKCRTIFHGFAHNFFVSHLFSTRKISNRRSWYALFNGQRVVNQIFLLARSRSWSNLVNSGQLWSNLVNIGQTFPNLEKCAPEYVLRALECNWIFFKSSRLSPNYLVLRVNTRENPWGKNRIMTTGGL